MGSTVAHQWKRAQLGTVRYLVQASSKALMGSSGSSVEVCSIWHCKVPGSSLIGGSHGEHSGSSV